MNRGLLHCTGHSNQDHPQEKGVQKGKMVVRGALQIVEKRKTLKAKEKRKDIPI